MSTFLPFDFLKQCRRFEFSTSSFSICLSQLSEYNYLMNLLAAA